MTLSSCVTGTRVGNFFGASTRISASTRTRHNRRASDALSRVQEQAVRGRGYFHGCRLLDLRETRGAVATCLGGGPALAPAEPPRHTPCARPGEGRAACPALSQ